MWECVCNFPFPALPCTYLEPLRKKKKDQGLRARGPTAPPLQGTGASGLGSGTWTERKEAQGPERRLQGR